MGRPPGPLCIFPSVPASKRLRTGHPCPRSHQVQVRWSGEAVLAVHHEPAEADHGRAGHPVTGGDGLRQARAVSRGRLRYALEISGAFTYLWQLGRCDLGNISTKTVKNDINFIICIDYITCICRKRKNKVLTKIS